MRATSPVNRPRWYTNCWSPTCCSVCPMMSIAIGFVVSSSMAMGGVSSFVRTPSFFRKGTCRHEPLDRLHILQHPSSLHHLV